MRAHKLGFIALFLAVLVVGAPAVLASDVLGIGYVDQAALANLKSFADATTRLRDYKQTLDGQFAAQMRGARSAAEQQRVADEFQSKLNDRQRDLFGPLLNKASVAVAAIASSKNLSVVLDKRIVVYGGVDVTAPVIDLLNGPADPVPPVNTPPPSSVGYVDQAQIDALPKIKQANDAFETFREQQQKIAQDKMARAKSDAERDQILKDFQKAVGDRQEQALKPLVDQTRDVIAGVARGKNLILVVDKSNVVYGGTDVTSDVTSSFK